MPKRKTRPTSETDTQIENERKKMTKKTTKKTVKETPKKAEPKKAAKKTAKKAEPKGAVKETIKKASAEKDKFGSRAGTIGAKMNAVVTKKSKTYDDILKDAEITPPDGTHYRKHLNNMVALGHFQKIDDKYGLV